MFDLFGPTTTELAQGMRQAIVHLTASQVAMIEVLIKAGLVTSEEFEQLVAAAISKVDQAVAKIDEEKQKEFDEQHPGLRETMEKLFGGTV